MCHDFFARRSERYRTHWIPVRRAYNKLRREYPTINIAIGFLRSTGLQLAPANVNFGFFLPIVARS
jgi:hypothetical protein